MVKSPQLGSKRKIMSISQQTSVHLTGEAGGAGGSSDGGSHLLVVEETGVGEFNSKNVEYLALISLF